MEKIYYNSVLQNGKIQLVQIDKPIEPTCRGAHDWSRLSVSFHFCTSCGLVWNRSGNLYFTPEEYNLINK